MESEFSAAAGGGEGGRPAKASGAEVVSVVIQRAKRLGRDLFSALNELLAAGVDWKAARGSRNSCVRGAAIVSFFSSLLTCKILPSCSQYLLSRFDSVCCHKNTGGAIHSGVGGRSGGSNRQSQKKGKETAQFGRFWARSQIRDSARASQPSIERKVEKEGQLLASLESAAIHSAVGTSQPSRNSDLRVT